MQIPAQGNAVCLPSVNFSCLDPGSHPQQAAQENPSVIAAIQDMGTILCSSGLPCTRCLSIPQVCGLDVRRHLALGQINGLFHLQEQRCHTLQTSSKENTLLQYHTQVEGSRSSPPFLGRWPYKKERLLIAVCIWAHH